MRWKTVIAAVVLGSLLGVAAATSIYFVFDSLLPFWISAGVAVAAQFVAPVACGVLFYAWRTRRDFPRDGLTRCGHCSYILKGLSEPRCPECGTRL